MTGEYLFFVYVTPNMGIDYSFLKVSLDCENRETLSKNSVEYIEFLVLLTKLGK
jgi:hypothetical protein